MQLKQCAPRKTRGAPILHFEIRKTWPDSWGTDFLTPLDSAVIRHK
jgi:hypothetical protein